MRARFRPALPRNRSRDRLLRGRAAAAARRGRAHRGADARGGPYRQSELDPRQRLVRRLRQARDHAAPVRRAFRHGPRASATAKWCSPAIRRTTRRCSAFSRIRWAWPTCANSRRCSATKPQYVTTAAAGAGFGELARASSCSEIATLLSRADYRERPTRINERARIVGVSPSMRASLSSLSQLAFSSGAFAQPGSGEPGGGARAARVRRARSQRATAT